jgi:MiaB-like tRNA modifying enzyme
MNRGDTEIMRGIAAGDHEIVEDPGECDVAVINSCGVVQRTENKVKRRSRALQSNGKKIVIAGCLPRINFAAVQEADGILSPGNLNLIGDALDAISRGERYVAVAPRRLDKTHLPRSRGDGVVAVVSISEGCLGSCSYCATRKARGGLKSFDPEGILRDVRQAVASGYREIQLTAQDTAAYGLDMDIRLPELLWSLVEIEGDFRLRLGMMNPGNALPIFKDLLKIFCCDKLYTFLHMPVQSGDDAILEKMNRGYSVEEFTLMAKAFKKLGGTLSTDVIVGYPGEDQESFLKTYRLIEEVRPDILNIKRFSPRPGTMAGRLKDMPDRLKKERSRALTRLHRRISLEENRKYLGREMRVLVTEEGKGSTVLARTDAYRQVVTSNGVLGEFKSVKIRDATPTYLVA